MTIDINKNSALIDSAASGYSGCGCGNRRYYTKAEIDEMMKGVLDPEEIEELLDQMFTEYIEGGDLYELILNALGDVYSKEQIDALLLGKLDVTAFTQAMAAETARTENTYLKDITLTINGTELHNNGSIIIEGGGTGGTIDLSDYAKTTAVTQDINTAIATETGRTEETYAKKNEIPSLSGYATEQWVENQGYLTEHQSLSGYATEQWVENQGYLTEHQSLADYYTKNETNAVVTSATQDMATKTWVGEQGYLTQHQDISGKLDTTAFTQFQTAMTGCCEEVRGEISDIWDAIVAITGGTTPTGSTGDWVIRVYLNVTSTTDYTKVTSESNGNIFKRATLDTGVEILDNIVWATGSGSYKFGNTGIRYIDFYYKNSATPYVDGGFGYMPSLVFAVVNDNVPRLGDVFYHSDSLTSVTIGNNVQEIGHSCFLDCDGLSAITIPDSVKTIGTNAFDGCTNLSDITIGSGLTTINQSAFRGCTSLDTVTFPNTLRRVESSAFSGCTALESVIFGTALAFLGDSCFDGCSSLNSITFTGAVPPAFDGDRTFYGVSPTGIYYYPTGYDYSRIANALPQGWVGVAV